MTGRRPSCRVVDVDGTPVLVHGVGAPTPRDLAILADAIAFLRTVGEPGGPMPANCKSCTGPIEWATMPTGKLMPIDAQPDPDGNIAARRNDRGDLVARVLKDGDELLEGERRGTSHFSSCPNAAAHRRPR